MGLSEVPVNLKILCKYNYVNKNLQLFQYKNQDNHNI